MSVINEIETERQRQISDKGYTHTHDDKHEYGELSRAAATYALFSGDQLERAGLGMHGNVPKSNWSELWPWVPASWKPEDPRWNLIRAAALIVAEIERMDRWVERTTP
jgi:hypothetical protein